MNKEVIPQGTLKILDIASIICGDRYRQDFGDLDGLRDSIKEKGILQPITVDSNLNLLAGERRVRAAKLAGLLKIPALVRKTAGEIDAREVELMENVMRKDFEWAERCALIKQIDDLYRSKDLTWSSRKTAQLLSKSVGGVSDAIKMAAAIEAVPELRNEKTMDDASKLLKNFEETAIVQELRNRQMSTTNNTLDKGVKKMLEIADANYMIQDTFKGMAGLRNNGVVNIIECDPPYGIDLRSLKRSKDNVGSNVHNYEEIDGEDYDNFLGKLAKELYRVAGPHCWLVFWFGPTWQTEVKVSLQEAGWLVDEIPCIWSKGVGQTMQPELYLARTYEPFFLCRKGNPVMMKRGRANVFMYAGDSKKYHPTQRPVELIEDILECIASPMSVCLVPFLGSGATLRACYNRGMKAWGYDINPVYKDKFMLAVEEDCNKLTALASDDE